MLNSERQGILGDGGSDCSLEFRRKTDRPVLGINEVERVRFYGVVEFHIEIRFLDDAITGDVGEYASDCCMLRLGSDE